MMQCKPRHSNAGTRSAVGAKRLVLDKRENWSTAVASWRASRCRIHGEMRCAAFATVVWALSEFLERQAAQCQARLVYSVPES